MLTILSKTEAAHAEREFGRDALTPTLSHVQRDNAGRKQTRNALAYSVVRSAYPVVRNTY